MKRTEQQKLQLKKAFDIHKIPQRGGAWFIPLAKLAGVYEELLPNSSGQGLQRLTMKVPPEDVGEFFCDLAIIGDEVVRTAFEFTLFNN